MSDYLPPLRDTDFLFNDVFDIPAWWAQTPTLADVVDGDTARAILEQAGKLIAEQVAPLNRSGDEQGCRWEAGQVRTPDGFADAYRAFAADGWVGVSGAPEYGADGTLGQANAVGCGSIEHKMGIKASATCVMNFDGAIGYLVGEPNKGLNAMFTMMNYERLGVGIQGLALGERSYQGAIAYARDRQQGRAPTGAEEPAQHADPIIVHPDVRRMLMTMKALNEGGRAFSTYVALQLDLAKYSGDPVARAQADAKVALLTPVAKAFLTDMGLETTVHGQQVLGGHGYIREWGQEQLIRDCRITQIYEGTNGIQALDLVGRKLFADGGEAYLAVSDELTTFAEALPAACAEFSAPLLAAVRNLDELSAWLLDRAQGNPRELGAAAVEYLQVFGYTFYAYLWARMAVVCQRQAALEPFHVSKLGTARFYFARLLPRIHSLSASVRAGSDSLYLLEAGQL